MEPTSQLRDVTLPDHELERAVVADVCRLVDAYTFDSAYWTEHNHELVAMLTLEQCAIWTTEVLEQEMHSGGFAAFFADTHGELNDYMRWSLSLLQADRYLDLVERAIAQYNKQSKAHYSALDREFTRLITEQPLSCLRANFIREHGECFNCMVTSN